MKRTAMVCPCCAAELAATTPDAFRFRLGWREFMSHHVQPDGRRCTRGAELLRLEDELRVEMRKAGLDDHV